MSKKSARAAMKHFSYTSYSFRITNAFRQSHISAEDAEDMVVGLSDRFYAHDLPRFDRTGSFDNRRKST